MARDRWSQVARGASTIILACLLGTLIAAQPARADTVQLSLHDGRVTIVADRATAAQILQAWSRLGDVTIVNADRVQGVPLTLRLEDMPEEQALDILLRSTGGYLARRRDTAAPGSIFDRIVITVASAAPREPSSPPTNAGTPANIPRPVFPQAPPPMVATPAAAPAAPTPTAVPPGGVPTGIPVAPGVTRLVGPDGQPVADDQGDAPTPTNTNPPAGSAAPQSPQQPPRPPSASAPAAPTPSTSAPAGVPRPGMTVPSGDQTAPTPGQPRR